MPSTYQSVVIDAPLESAWKRVRDSHDCSFAPRVLPDCQAVGEKGGTEVGARRVLSGVFHETLTHHDDGAHTFSYSIDDGPSPVSSAEVRHYMESVRLRRPPRVAAPSSSGVRAGNRTVTMQSFSAARPTGRC